MALNPNFSLNKDATLRDVNATSLQVAGNLTVGGSIAPGTFTNRVVVLNQAAAAVLTTNLTAAQSGTTFVLTGTGGQVINLPVLPVVDGAATGAVGNTNACSVGARYAFHIAATVNAGSLYIIQSAIPTSQDMLGAVASSNLNTATLSGSGGVWGPTAAGQSIMTMDGTDRGGVLGSYVEFEAVANQVAGGTANVCWRVGGRILAPAAAAVATPFS